MEHYNDKIPVLFTTYNRIEYTRQALPVLLENTDIGHIFIYDNGSEDGTQEWLNEGEYIRPDRPEPVLCLADRNTGVGGAMNWFFNQTQGYKWVAKVDNDTMVPEGWLTELVTIAEKHLIDIIQANHHFKIRDFKTWEDLEERSVHVIHNDKGSIVKWHLVGGSGVLINRERITEHIDTSTLLNGWSVFQSKHPELNKALYNGVWVDLLDMEDNAKRADGVDTEYYKSIGRDGEC